MTNDKATPGPWHVETVPIESRGGGLVCHKIGPFQACIYDDWRQVERGFSSEELLANARLIVEAVNNYDDLVEALEWSTAHLQPWYEDDDRTPRCRFCDKPLAVEHAPDCPYCLARAALARVKGASDDS